MKNSLFILFLCLGVHFSLIGQVDIQGNNLSYAGMQLTVRTYSDAFTYHEEVLATTTFQPNGDFKVSIDISEPRLIYIPIGIYKGFLFAEPGKSYNIKLPPRKDKTAAQKLNPFFEQEELLLGIADASDSELNLLIRRFDDQLDNFINSNINRIYNKAHQSVGLKYMKELKAQFASCNNTFFNQYIEYRLGLLEYLSYPRSFTMIENKYFKGKKIQYYNPAYCSLFKKLYSNFLSGYLDRKESSALSNALSSNNIYKATTDILKGYEAYSDESFRNIVILKGAYDACNSKIYPRKKMLSLLEGVATHSKDLNQQIIAQNMISQLTHLERGDKAPDFHIIHQKEEFNMTKYKGKFLYINFCHTQNYACQQDMLQIANLHKNFGDKICFLTIATDWDISKENTFLDGNKFSWPVIPVGENKQIIRDYNVRAYPTYILIDRRGRIIKAPAPGPKEHIDYEFFKITKHLQRQEYKQKTDSLKKTKKNRF